MIISLIINNACLFYQHQCKCALDQLLAEKDQYMKQYKEVLHQLKKIHSEPDYVSTLYKYLYY